MLDEHDSRMILSTLNIRSHDFALGGVKARGRARVDLLSNKYISSESRGLLHVLTLELLWLFE